MVCSIMGRQSTNSGQLPPLATVAYDFPQNAAYNCVQTLQTVDEVSGVDAAIAENPGSP